MQNECPANGTGSHVPAADSACEVASAMSVRAGRGPGAALALAIFAYIVAVGVLYAALRWTEMKVGGTATTVSLLPGESNCSNGHGKCAAAPLAVRAARGLVPVASQEVLDDVLDRRAAEGSTTRFDEHCRPLPAVATESQSDETILPPDASPSPPDVAGDGPKPAVAPTPAPPDLARAQPQRFVLMVEVEARHDPGARP